MHIELYVAMPKLFHIHEHGSWVLYGICPSQVVNLMQNPQDLVLQAYLDTYFTYTKEMKG